MYDDKVDAVVDATTADKKGSSSGDISPIPAHGSPEIIGSNEDGEHHDGAIADVIEEKKKKKGGRFAYLLTKEFYFVLLLGYD